MTFVIFSELVRNVVLSIAAVVGVVTARQGLSSWRNQKKWEVESELSKRILVALYHYRETLLASRFRVPGPTAVYDIEDMDSDYPVSQELRKLSKETLQAKSVFDALLIESEAFWEKSLTGMAEDLFELHKELQDELSLIDILHDNKCFEDEKDWARDKLHKSKGYYMEKISELDSFEVKLNHLIKPIEDYLRPKFRL